MREHENAGAAAGKVRRPPARGDAGPMLIDSAGIAVRADRAAFDRGEGEPEGSAFCDTEEVFAVSGAALFARRSALDDVAVDGEYLDEAFFMYKDDVDLCWRMRLRGWECWYVPAAGAFHVRSGRGLGGRRYRAGAVAYLRNERAKPAHVRVHSLKNEWLMLLKNDSARSSLPDLPRIALRQALLAGTTAVLSPRLLLRALRMFAAAIPNAWRWRSEIRRRAVVDPRVLRARWFVR
jgi:GT2 family glycosyltransferase